MFRYFLLLCLCLSCLIIFFDFFDFLEWPIRNTKDSGDYNFNLGQARLHRSTETAKEKKWSDDQMVGAIQAVINDGLSMNQAADNYQVPRSTLKDRLSGRVTHGVNPGPKPYLTKDEEQGLADYLISAANTLGMERLVEMSFA